MISSLYCWGFEDSPPRELFMAVLGTDLDGAGLDGRGWAGLDRGGGVDLDGSGVVGLDGGRRGGDVSLSPVFSATPEVDDDL